MFAQSKTALQVVGEAPADAIDFDGTNDYLSRSSGLAGNADGKTFTFSVWMYVTGDNQFNIYQTSQTLNPGIEIYQGSLGGNFIIRAYNSSASRILDANIIVANKSPVKYGFYHILASIDLANQAGSKMYLNDELVNSPFITFTNAIIDFTKSTHTIVSQPNSSGRLAHLYLDYTYRDLSIEANRRLFITADRKPAKNQAALNPILYLPLNDPTQPGKNLGTGGDFNLTGVVARSGRGPNQFNAPYSDLDGSADVLSRTVAPVGITNSKKLTLSFTFQSDSVSTGGVLFSTYSSPAGNIRFRAQLSSGRLTILGYNTAGARAFTVSTPVNYMVSFRNYHVLLSFDLSDLNSRHFRVNGVEMGGWSNYENDAIALVNTFYAIGGGAGATFSGSHNGRLGNFFFDTKYIDLSQPVNLAKFVTGTGIDAKPVDLGANGELPFGTPPLIYLPMYGNNAGKNYGTGGDFTVNSGPYPGARGPNEFWGNKAVFDGTTGYLRRTSALVGVNDSKTFSLVFSSGTVATGSPTTFVLRDSSGVTASLQVYRNSNTGGIAIDARNSAGVLILGAVSNTIWNETTFFICVDLANNARRKIFLGNTEDSVNWNTYVNDAVKLTTVNSAMSANFDGTTANGFKPGHLSEFYFTADYIDFSQEANRLKFRDAFGNPVDLAPQIKAGTLPNPAIYMRFDPANFGKNSGTGGDFTVNGTITDGGQL